MFVGAHVVQDRHASNPLSIALRAYHCVVLVDPQIGEEEGAREAPLSHSLKMRANCPEKLITRPENPRL